MISTKTHHDSPAKIAAQGRDLFQLAMVPPKRPTDIEKVLRTLKPKPHQNSVMLHSGMNVSAWAMKNHEMQREAIYGQMVGQEYFGEIDKCSRCEDGKGPFIGCMYVSIPDDGSKLWNGACMNCRFEGKERQCSRGMCSFSAIELLFLFEIRLFFETPSLFETYELTYDTATNEGLEPSHTAVPISEPSRTAEPVLEQEKQPNKALEVSDILAMSPRTINRNMAALCVQMSVYHRALAELERRRQKGHENELVLNGRIDYEAGKRCLKVRMDRGTVADKISDGVIND
jgi:hypothetical protein